MIAGGASEGLTARKVCNMLDVTETNLCVPVHGA